MREKGDNMKDIIVSILTDDTTRDDAAVETALMQQATAAPWSSIEEA